MYNVQYKFKKQSVENFICSIEFETIINEEKKILLENKLAKKELVNNIS